MTNQLHFKVILNSVLWRRYVYMIPQIQYSSQYYSSRKYPEHWPLIYHFSLFHKRIPKALPAKNWISLYIRCLNPRPSLSFLCLVGPMKPLLRLCKCTGWIFVRLACHSPFICNTSCVEDIKTHAYSNTPEHLARWFFRLLGQSMLLFFRFKPS